MKFHSPCRVANIAAIVWALAIAAAAVGRDRSTQEWKEDVDLELNRRCLNEVRWDDAQIAMKVFLLEVVADEAKKPDWWKSEVPEECVNRGTEAIADALRAGRASLDKRKPRGSKRLASLNYHTRLVRPTLLEEKPWRSSRVMVVPVDGITQFTLLKPGWGLQGYLPPVIEMGNGEHDKYIFIKDVKTIDSTRIVVPDDHRLDVRKEVQRMLELLPPTLSVGIVWSIDRTKEHPNVQPETISDNFHFQQIEGVWCRREDAK